VRVAAQAPDDVKESLDEATDNVLHRLATRGGYGFKAIADPLRHPHGKVVYGTYRAGGMSVLVKSSPLNNSLAWLVRAHAYAKQSPMLSPAGWRPLPYWA
jgi:hypothetical protein